MVVVSSRSKAFGLERARKRGVTAETVSKKQYSSVEAFSEAVFKVLRPHQPDLVCLAGFMSLLKIPDDFENRILNIHPSLLPSFGGKGFYGDHVHKAVVEQGCKISGCTVHFVNNEYDQGPIVAQRAVPVEEDDDSESLGERVREAERILYPEVIRLYAQGRLNVEGRRVRIQPAK